MSASKFLYPVININISQRTLDMLPYIDPTRVIITSVISKYYDTYTGLSNKVVTPMICVYDWYAPASGVIGFMSAEGVKLSVILNKFGITYPRTVAYKVNDNTQMVFGKKYVLKSDMSARSVGKAVVTRETFISMCNFIKNVVGKPELFNSTFNINVGKVLNDNDGEKYRLHDSLIHANLVIQDYVDIDKEYRYYYFNTGKPKSSFVYRRIGCRIDVNEPEDTYRVPKKTVPKRFLDKIDKLAQHYHLPWLVVDIYQDKNGNWGVFEMDMTYQYMDNPELIADIGESTTDALIHTIRELNPCIKAVADNTPS